MADKEEYSTSQPVERRRQLQADEITRVPARNEENNMGGSAGAGSLVNTIRFNLDVGKSRLRELIQDIGQSLNIEGLHVRVRGAVDNRSVRSSEEAAVPLLDLLAQHAHVPKVSATLGLSEDGSTIFHDFSSPDTPHLLVVGGHDAGKTVMLRSIAASLAMHNRQSEIQLAAMSPVMNDKERQRVQAESWFPLNYLPHMMCDVAFRHTEIVELLAFLDQEIGYREDHSFALPRLIVLIDQADVLLTRGGQQCAEPIMRIAEKGERVGIHLVLSTRAIDSATFGSQLMKKMSTRLIGRPDTKMPEEEPLFRNDARQLLGEGDFLFSQKNHIRRLQGSYIDDYDLYLKLTQMVRQKAILLARPAENKANLKQPSENQAPPVLWPSTNVDNALAVIS